MRRRKKREEKGIGCEVMRLGREEIQRRCLAKGIGLMVSTLKVRGDGDERAIDNDPAEQPTKQNKATVKQNL